MADSARPSSSLAQLTTDREDVGGTYVCTTATTTWFGTEGVEVSFSMSLASR